MHIISMRRLREFWQQHSDAESSVRAWYMRVSRARWRNFPELRDDFPTADLVERLTVFDIGGNKYRLIARIEYERQRLYIRSVMTHAEYSRDRWKNDPSYS